MKALPLDLHVDPRFAHQELREDYRISIHRWQSGDVLVIDAVSDDFSDRTEDTPRQGRWMEFKVSINLGCGEAREWEQLLSPSQREMMEKGIKELREKLNAASD